MKQCKENETNDKYVRLLLKLTANGSQRNDQYGYRDRNSFERTHVSPPLPRLPLEVSNPVTMWCDGCRLAHVALGFCLFQKGLSVCKHPLTQPHVFSCIDFCHAHADWLFLGPDGTTCACLGWEGCNTPKHLFLSLILFNFWRWLCYLSIFIYIQCQSLEPLPAFLLWVTNLHERLDVDRLLSIPPIFIS